MPITKDEKAMPLDPLANSTQKQFNEGVKDNIQALRLNGLNLEEINDQIDLVGNVVQDKNELFLNGWRWDKDNASSQLKVINDAESLWTADNGNTTPTANTTAGEFIQGSQSMKLTGTAAGTIAAYFDVSLDLTAFASGASSALADYIFFWFYVPDVSIITDFKMHFYESSAARTGKRAEATIDTSGWTNGINQAFIRKNAFTYQSGFVDADWALIDGVYANVTINAGGNFSLDNFLLLGSLKTQNDLLDAADRDSGGIIDNTDRIETANLKLLSLDENSRLRYKNEIMTRADELFLVLNNDIAGGRGQDYEINTFSRKTITSVTDMVQILADIDWEVRIPYFDTSNTTLKTHSTYGTVLSSTVPDGTDTLHNLNIVKATPENKKYFLQAKFLFEADCTSQGWYFAKKDENNYIRAYVTKDPTPANSTYVIEAVIESTVYSLYSSTFTLNDDDTVNLIVGLDEKRIDIYSSVNDAAYDLITVDSPTTFWDGTLRDYRQHIGFYSTDCLNVLEIFTTGSQFAIQEELTFNEQLEVFQAAATGTDTYAVSTGKGVTVLSSKVFLINFGFTNTTNATLDIDGTGAKALYKEVSTNLAASDLVVGKEYVVIYDSSADAYQIRLDAAGGGGGEVNTASNVTSGGGIGIWKTKNVFDLEFKSLLPDNNISITGGTNDVTIESPYEVQVGAAVESSANVYTFTSGESLVPADINGIIFALDFPTTNTAAITLEVDGNGAKAVKKDGSTDLASSDINIGQTYYLVYDGVNFQITGIAGAGGGVTGGTNLGAGEGVFAGLSVTTMQFKSLTVSKNLGISSTANEIDFTSPFEVEAGTVAAGTQAYTLTTGNSLLAADLPEMVFAIEFANNNTGVGETTLNVDGIGIKNIKKNITDTLAADDIVAGQLYILVYDGVNFQLLTTGSGSTATFSDIVVTNSITAETAEFCLDLNNGANQRPTTVAEMTTTTPVLICNPNAGANYTGIAFQNRSSGVSTGAFIARWLDTNRTEFLLLTADDGSNMYEAFKITPGDLTPSVTWGTALFGTKMQVSNPQTTGRRCEAFGDGAVAIALSPSGSADDCTVFGYGADVTTDGGITDVCLFGSSTRGADGSCVFGSLSRGDGANAIAIGNRVYVSGGTSICIGGRINNAVIASDNGAIVIGYNSYSTLAASGGHVFIGQRITSGTAGNFNNIVMGEDISFSTGVKSDNIIFSCRTSGTNLVGGSNNIYIGHNYTVTATTGSNIIFGNNCNVGAFTNAMLLGHNANANGSNRVVIGSDDTEFEDVWIGRGTDSLGFTYAASSAGLIASEAASYTIHASDTYTFTNQTGGSLGLAGGTSRGTGFGGSVTIWTAPQGVSGTNAIRQIASFDYKGTLNFTNQTAVDTNYYEMLNFGGMKIWNATGFAPGSLTTPTHTNGDLIVNSTNGTVFARISGAWVDLNTAGGGGLTPPGAGLVAYGNGAGTDIATEAAFAYNDTTNNLIVDGDNSVALPTTTMLTQANFIAKNTNASAVYTSMGMENGSSDPVRVEWLTRRLSPNNGDLRLRVRTGASTLQNVWVYDSSSNDFFFDAAVDLYHPGSGSSSTVFGNNATATGASTAVYGLSASANSDNSCSFGYLAHADQTNTCAFGHQANANHASSICLGSLSASTAANQFIVGSITARIATMYIGEGVANGNGNDVTIRNTNRPTGGTNNNLPAGDTIIAVGLGTGSGTPGSVVIRSANTNVTANAAHTDEDTLTVFSGGSTLLSRFLFKKSLRGDNLTTVTGTTATLDDDDFQIHCDTATAAAKITLTLPAISASNAGIIYIIKDTGFTANGVDLTRSSTDTIENGSTTISPITASGEGIIVTNDGSSVWYVVAKF